MELLPRHLHVTPQWRKPQISNMGCHQLKLSTSIVEKSFRYNFWLVKYDSFKTEHEGCKKRVHFLNSECKFIFLYGVNTKSD